MEVEKMLRYLLTLVLVRLDALMGSTSQIKSLGCWIREHNGIPAISSLERTNENLMDNYWERADPIQSCARAAATLGHNVFAVSNGGIARGGECFSSCSAAKDFAMYGHRGAVCVLGTGGYISMNVYSLDVTRYLGCIKNRLGGYIIPDLESTHPALFGQPRNREYPIEKCGAIARSKGYTVFGITKGGRCLGSGDAYDIYLQHGAASGPGKDCVLEKGSEHSISVHLITGIVEFNRESRQNNTDRTKRKKKNRRQ